MRPQGKKRGVCVCVWRARVEKGKRKRIARTCEIIAEESHCHSTKAKDQKMEGWRREHLKDAGTTGAQTIPNHLDKPNKDEMKWTYLDHRYS